ncbi:MAG: geranylgeranylglycerol-phosphate geranylgeranyltransferase [archaeon]
MNPYWDIIRPNVCFLAALGVFVGAIVSGATGIIPLSIAVLAAFLICAGGNVINDYYDYEIDLINKPKRPLPSGKMTRDKAFAYYFILSAAGIALSLLVSSAFFTLAILNYLISTLYAWKLKKIAIIGNITDAFLGGVTFLAGGLIKGTVISLLGSPVLILALIAFMTTMGREIFKDIEDIIGDNALGARTLPIIAGTKISTALARMFVAISAISAILPYRYHMFDSYYMIAVIPCMMMLLYSATVKDPKTAQKTVKKGMFLGIFAFLVGAFTI